MAADTLKDLLRECKLDDKADKISDTMYLLRWGSAKVIAGTSGDAVVVIAPLFDKLPERRTEEFLRRLLEINSSLGGTAGFALSTEGGVVLQTGRSVKGGTHYDE